MEQCISTQVPDNADLILLEYTVNDLADEVFRARLEAQRDLPQSCKNGFDDPARYPPPPAVNYPTCAHIPSPKSSPSCLPTVPLFVPPGGGGGGAQGGGGNGLA